MRAARDSRRELVRRVAASREFRRCPRLRELLLLLCECAIADPSRELRASEMAAVFARPPLGDALEADNLVRAHVTRLRQRLAEYFDGGGAHEEIVVEIPTPGCTPVFRARQVPRAAAARRSPATMIAGVVAVLLVASAAFGVRRVEPPRLLADEAAAVDRFWAQMFGRRGRVSLVVGTVDDGPSEGPLTSIVDARVAQRVGALASSGRLDMEIVPAREAGASLLMSGDAILTGPPRANPWLAPFEPRLSFRALFDEASHVPAFENVRPREGEARRYVAGEGRGYCRVAWLPSLDGTGSVLLLSGTEMASTEAGLELVTRGSWIERLRARLRLGPRDACPHFEALLATEVFAASAARFELIAARRLDTYPFGR